LPGHFIAKGDNRRAAGGPSGRLSTASGSGHRRVAYPGAPRSLAGGGTSWMEMDDQLSPYVMTLRRYPRLYAARGGRLVPAVWPRRVFGGMMSTRQRLRGHDANLTARTTPEFTSVATSVSTTPSIASTPPSTTPSTTTSTTETTTTTTTTTTMTTTKLSTTTGDEQQQQQHQQQELTAAVHDMRQRASSDDKNVLLLDVGAPEIGELFFILIVAGILCSL